MCPDRHCFCNQGKIIVYIGVHLQVFSYKGNPMGFPFLCLSRHLVSRCSHTHAQQSELDNPPASWEGSCKCFPLWTFLCPYITHVALFSPHSHSSTHSVVYAAPTNGFKPMGASASEELYLVSVGRVFVFNALLILCLALRNFLVYCFWVRRNLPHEDDDRQEMDTPLLAWEFFTFCRLISKSCINL